MERCCFSRLCLVAVVSCAPAVGGCQRQEEDDSAPQKEIVEREATQAAASGSENPTEGQSEEPRALLRALELFERGEVAVARNTFLELEWSKDTEFPKDSVLSMSEEEFKALPRLQRAKVGREARAKADVMRDLCREVLRAAERAEADDEQVAAAHYAAVKRFIRFLLDRPESLAVFRALGEGLQRAVETENTPKDH